MAAFVGPRGSAAAEPQYAVATAEFHWVDAARGRSVPATLFYPFEHGPVPVVVFSHGLGRDRQAYAYLGRYWAERGIATLLVEHLGSDDAAWRGKLMPKRALREVNEDPAEPYRRPRDLTFAIDMLAELVRREPVWAARLDPRRVGVAGNDLGAAAALTLAGARTPHGDSLADARVKAVIAMSPPVPQGANLAEVFGGVTVPCLHMTGTADDGIVGSTKAYQRRWPFDHISAAAQYLVVFYGGDHLIYSGDPRSRGNEKRNDAPYQRLICEASAAFWRTYLEDRADDPRRVTVLRVDPATGAAPGSAEALATELSEIVGHRARVEGKP